MTLVLTPFVLEQDEKINNLVGRTFVIDHTNRPPEAHNRIEVVQFPTDVGDKMMAPTVMNLMIANEKWCAGMATLHELRLV